MQYIAIISLFAAFFMTVVVIINMITDGLGACIKRDSGTAYRRKKDKKLAKRALVMVILYAIAFLSQSHVM